MDAQLMQRGRIRQAAAAGGLEILFGNGPDVLASLWAESGDGPAVGFEAEVQRLDQPLNLFVESVASQFGMDRNDRLLGVESPSLQPVEDRRRGAVVPARGQPLREHVQIAGVICRPTYPPQAFLRLLA